MRLILAAALAVAVTSQIAFAGAASATTVISSGGSTPSFTATSTNSKLDGSFVTVECGHSEAKGKVESHGAGVNATGKISSLTFTSCNYPTTVKKAGSVSAEWLIGGSNGFVYSTGAEVSIHTSVGTCVFTTNNTFIGVFTGGRPASFDIAGAIPRTGGNFLCGSTGTWTGNYTITNLFEMYLYK